MNDKPKKVLYSNDTTNIESCTSAYSPRRFDGGSGSTDVVFTDDSLFGSVDETANTGIDVHMLQPGLGWVPWWKSKIYPFEQHIEFMKKFGKVPSDSSFALYMAKGGDMVAAFTTRCREKGISPFISFRLNDSHGHEFLAMDHKDIPGWAWHCLCPVHVEHPSWRLSNDINNWAGRVLNWSIPEVRAFKFGLIKEIIENYDLDGFELDFMRFFNFFDLEKTQSKERRAIINGFVKDVRALLDDTAKPEQHRWLCVRVPCFLESHDQLGIYLPDLAEAGVDMVNVSPSYFTVQQTDLPEICKLIPQTPVYLEMCHTTVTSTKRLPGSEYDNFVFRRTTDEQYYTAAHLAYSRGAYGVSAFNFAYYREHGTEGRGPFNEPPFHIFEHMSDRQWLARQPQHYVLTAIWPSPPSSMYVLPVALIKGKSYTFSMDMAPPSGGWTSDGRLRLESEEDMGNARFSVRVNSVAVESTDDVSEPYESPYTNMLGDKTNIRAFTIPKGVLREGNNRIQVLMEAGETVKINYIDLAIR